MIDYAEAWGDRYVTSNVKVFKSKSGTFEYVGATHRYFTTEKGLRVMAFGVLFDFTGMFTMLIRSVDGALTTSRQLKRFSSHPC